MKNQRTALGILLFLTLFSVTGIAAKETETLESLVNATRIVDSPIDLHLTSDTEPLKNSTVNIVSEEAWLFFDNMKPSKVFDNYGSAIKIKGETMNYIGTAANCRLVVYKQGAVVIPHPAGFQPLETFTEPDFGGESQRYSLDNYYTNKPASQIKQSMRKALPHDNSIRSFKLKRGYMATFANEPDGLGYSRIFIADEDDLTINLPKELDSKVSFIRVFEWQYVSKKGWCGGEWKGQANGWKFGDEQSDHTNSTWYYHWGVEVGGSANAKIGTLINQEFIPEKWGSGGDYHEFFQPKWSHLVGYNEPDHEEQSNTTVATGIREWPNMLKTGTRVGSPATTDFNWLYDFIDQCDRYNYRVDYVVIHCYWGGKSPQNWYNDLKKVHERTGRPIWIKEWNNGANWTNEKWPDGDRNSGRPYTPANAQKQLDDLKEILQVLDTASFVERYSIYNWVEDARAIILNNKLTLAGEYYASTKPDMAFNRDKEVIPTWSTLPVQLSATFSDETNKTAFLSWKDSNGELSTSYIIERSKDGRNYEQIGTIDNTSVTEFETTVPPLSELPKGMAYYRVQTVGFDGLKQASNIIKYDYFEADKERVRIRHSSGLYLTVDHNNPNNSWTIADNRMGDNNQIFEFVYPTDGNNSVFNLLTYEDRYMSNKGASAWNVVLSDDPTLNTSQFRFVDTPNGMKIQCLARTASQFLGVDVAASGATCYLDKNFTNNSDASKRKYDIWTIEDILPPPPPTELPVAGKTYHLIHSSGLYLTVDKSNSNDSWNINTLKNNDPKQVVKLVNPNPSEPDVYNIATYEGEYLTNKVQGSSIWSAIVGTDPDAAVSKFRFVEHGDFLKIQCLARTVNQYIGVDATTPGSFIYLDKNYDASGNGYDWWRLVETSGFVGLESVDVPKALFVYPTVTDGLLYINREDGTRITVFGITGEKVMETHLQGGAVNVSTLSAGVYILATEEGRQAKFVKE